MDNLENSNDTQTPDDEDNLASRWYRLWAALIDGLIVMVFTMPVMYLTGGFEGALEGIQPSWQYTLLMGLLGIVVFVLINGKLLAQRGQTIGKRALGIKIVTLSGELPSVKSHLLKRYAVYFLLGNVPTIGQLLSLANVLAIFGEQKRCGHDYVAGTMVVNV
ncbi:RDD family protein [Gilvimarinus algae]|uniref:RDD family protein n=1 Tax=Gilvimarinus algae TaxID=3058037 RepID=A0ABT8TI36_9GAMM|nr:RDD family protein [Gilvimarinus sp. SDUM040014]MDO3383748.1 RDD family protein [Gilvimarinus sp. SDUM040014]